MTEFWVDVSSNNPMPNVAEYAAAGHTHICRKVSEGTGYHWAAGDGLADQAHQHGLTVGHYHWLRPDTHPELQADHFVSLLAGHTRPGDCLMTDFERSPVPDPGDATRAQQLATFNQRVRQAFPSLDLHVYTGNWYLDGRPKMQAECRRWPVVMSDYSGRDTLPNPYGLTYVGWQFTDHADVTGCPAPVDYNRWLPAHTYTAPSSSIPEADMAEMILTINPKDCAPKKKGAPAWPGYFHYAGGTLTHITSSARYLALRHLGIPAKAISFADYYALGGK